jgi:large subunit ribosomal protein L23
MKHENAVLKAVMQTEKGAALQEKQNRYMVRVDRAATKPEIKKAVETVFGVHVLKVRTANMKGGLRTIRGTRRQVTESTWKRAIVTVKAGERIETL